MVVTPTSLSIMEGDIAASIVPNSVFVSSTTFGEVASVKMKTANTVNDKMAFNQTKTSTYR